MKKTPKTKSETASETASEPKEIAPYDYPDGQSIEEILAKRELDKAVTGTN
jgi:hypothetical protein